jgi:hypothetical protein
MSYFTLVPFHAGILREIVSKLETNIEMGNWFPGGTSGRLFGRGIGYRKRIQCPEWLLNNGSVP